MSTNTLSFERRLKRFFPIVLFITMGFFFSVSYASDCTGTRVVDLYYFRGLVSPPKDYIDSGQGVSLAVSDVEAQTGLKVTYIDRWTGTGWQRHNPDDFFVAYFDMYHSQGYMIEFNESASGLTWEGDFTLIDCEGNGAVAELFIMSIVSRTQYQIGDVINVETQLYNGTTHAPVNDATCSINIYYPNKTVWLEDIETTVGSNGLYYNNSYYAQMPVGIYTYQANCTVDDTSKYDAYTFQVVGSNHIYFLIISGMGLATLIFIYLGYNSKEEWSKILFTMLGFIFLISMFGTMLEIINIENSSSFFDGLYGIVSTSYTTVILIFLLTLAIIFIKFIQKIVEDMKL